MSYIVSKKGKKGNHYHVVFTLPNGKKKWQKAGTKKKEAQALQRKIDAESALGAFGLSSDVKFKEYAQTWLSRNVLKRVKKRTYMDYEQVVRTHLEPFFGEMKLSRISPEQVQQYIAEKNSSDLSARTVNKTITILKMLFNSAVQLGHLNQNPARYAKGPRDTKEEMKYLSQDEVKRLLEAADPDYRALFATAVLTGAREGEILALHWKDVDLEKGFMRITQSYHPDQGFTTPKTKYSRRTIIISPELILILQAHREATFSIGSELVFPTSNGTPINYHNMSKLKFKPALKKAGINSIRFHDLRHTYAAFMIAMRESMKFIQRQLGHASISTTMDIYGHLLPEVSNGFGERLDNLIFHGEEVESPSPEDENPDDGGPEEVENG